MSRCTILLKNICIPSGATVSIPSASLHPWERATIILNPKSALEPFQRLQRSLRCILSSDSSSLAYWNLRWTVLKSYIFPQRHKWLISSIQRTELFPLLSTQREDFRWSRLFDYTSHLVSTSRPFWEYDCLLEASSFLGRQQQFLAEAQYSEKFKLKFVRILVTLYITQFLPS